MLDWTVHLVYTVKQYKVLLSVQSMNTVFISYWVDSLKKEGLVMLLFVSYVVCFYNLFKTN